MPISRDVVIDIYRSLLGREPETDEVVLSHMMNSPSDTEFITRVCNSDEFAARSFMRSTSESFYASAAPIQVEVTEDELGLLVDRVRRQWQSLGETEPYWSVLSEERYLSKNISRSDIRALLAEGGASAGLIELFEKKANTTVCRRVCFELGCGVGRVTYHLAQKFEHVIAADISSANLAICKANLQAAGVTNVSFVLVNELADFDELAEFDFMFSVIVLQHNAPPVQRYLIDKLAGKVRSGGGCLFQAPASLPGYSFNVTDYVQSTEQKIEMHAIPMATVLEILQNNGLTVLQVMPDSWTGSPGSFTYFAVRR